MGECTPCTPPLDPPLVGWGIFSSLLVFYFLLLSTQHINPHLWCESYYILNNFQIITFSHFHLPIGYLGYEALRQHPEYLS